jgi:hypothetical protein
MVWKAKIQPGQTRDLPRLLIGMSFSEVSLGGLLSSRARLRFPRWTHSGTTGSRSSSNVQRTANCRTTLCLIKGRRPSLLVQQAENLNSQFTNSPKAIIGDMCR